MIKWYEFKKLYVASNTDNCMFKAYIADKDTYKIILEDNNLFSNIFLSIINGSYIMSPIIYDKEGIPKYEYIKIDNHDAIKNIQKYISMISNNKVRQRFIFHEINIKII